MGNLSKELSSWRKQVVTCKSGIITTIDFMDTRPNIMFIMNPTEAILLASIDHSPTPKNYDFKIKGHYTRLIGKPTRTRQCYIYNDSSIDCDVQVYSLYDEKFDPSWIKDFNIENVNISSETLDTIRDMITGKVVIDGVKEGLKLPVEDKALTGKIVDIFNVINNNIVNTTTAVNNSVNSNSSKFDIIGKKLDSILSSLQVTTNYVSLVQETNFEISFTELTHVKIPFIVGNGTLQFVEGSKTVNIPINGFMRDLQFSGENITIKYVKPTDEIENAYILYKKW